MVLVAAFLPACAGKSSAAKTSFRANSAVAPSMGTAESFAVLGGQAVTNTGATVITGNVGVSPGTAVTGFPPGSVIGGTIHAADAVALQAESDTTTAYLNLAGQACDATYGVPTDIGGTTLAPGVYCFSSSAQLTGTLTLDAGGVSDAVWVFKTVSTLVTASNSSVRVINGGIPCNVYWQVGSSATLGTGTMFVGNILALTSISLQTNAHLSGRALARNGEVTMDSNVVTIDECGGPTPTAPTLTKTFTPDTIVAGGISTVTITLSNADATAAILTAPLTDILPSGLAIAGTANTDCGGVLTVDPGDPSSVTLTGGSIPAEGSCTVTVNVTAALPGLYCNELLVGALQTSNGSNAVYFHADLTVNAGVTSP